GQRPHQRNRGLLAFVHSQPLRVVRVEVEAVRYAAADTLALNTELVLKDLRRTGGRLLPLKLPSEAHQPEHEAADRRCRVDALANGVEVFLEPAVIAERRFQQT